MADVLLGRTDGIEGFERHVVLKRIRAEHARDRRFISMFVDEARLAAGLHHQHIVQVFDIGEENGEYFFAMEYIHGEDVRKLLSNVARSRGYVPLPIVCAILSAAASGLHYAHERRDSKGKPLSIVHRDVSPSNVLIAYDGAVKIVDFGIAKATMRTAETVVGSLKGKCSYMSPEQCKSEPVDRRSDVYGLGVLLYELATTTRLFKGDNEYLVMDAIVNGKFALPQVRRPDLPNELSSIIMRALATDPNRRYQTADELRSELDQFAENQGFKGSNATLASYMKKIFGERPEPWLDLSADPEPAGHSWSDTASGAPRDSRRSARHLLSPQRTAPAVDTAPTMKLGWEATRHLHRARTNKWLWAIVPAIALVGFAIWKVASKDDSAPAPVAQVAAPAPAEPMRVVGAPAAAPSPSIVPAATAQIVAAAAPAVAPPAAAPTVKETPKAPGMAMTVETPRKSPPPAPTKTKKTELTAPVAVAPAPAPVAVAPTAKAAPAPAAARPAPNPVVAVAAAVAPPPVAAPAPAAAPAIVAAPVEKQIDAAPIPSLSNATVSAIASDHSGQLSACEKGVSLKGDVAVSFQVDASGKVVRTQLSSTIKNPKVAGCILRAVSSWKFAKPPSGAAKGVYSISYQ